MSALPDDSYDIFVVDAEDVDASTLRLELTIVAGPSKGEVVAVTASGLQRDAIDCLGLPGKLFVESGVPRVELET